jgi:hypothetical protein
MSKSLPPRLIYTLMAWGLYMELNYLWHRITSQSVKFIFPDSHHLTRFDCTGCGYSVLFFWGGGGKWQILTGYSNGDFNLVYWLSDLYAVTCSGVLMVTE